MPCLVHVPSGDLFQPQLSFPPFSQAVTERKNKCYHILDPGQLMVVGKTMSIVPLGQSVNVAMLAEDRQIAAFQQNLLTTTGTEQMLLHSCATEEGLRGRRFCTLYVCKAVL